MGRRIDSLGEDRRAGEEVLGRGRLRLLCESKIPGVVVFGSKRLGLLWKKSDEEFVQDSKRERAGRRAMLYMFTTNREIAQRVGTCI